MTDYSRLYSILKDGKFSLWLDTMPKQIDAAFSNSNHGKFGEWEMTLSELLISKTQRPKLKDGKIVFENIDTNKNLTKILMEFHPWRKGPYKINNTIIDTEWRSDLKWDRVKKHITPLKDRTVLDIGSGNGYHLWRMVLDGAKLALGIDPYLLSVMQFNVINSFSVDLPIFTVPLGVDDIPDRLNAFDTVFSMGLLYHRREPLDHIKKLFHTVVNGGEIVLETLIVERDNCSFFVPKGRYAKMRNVWNLPSVLQVESWLKEAGFENIKTVDITKTTTEEQRSTDWMNFESLSDFLDKDDSNKTIVGHPAPVRAIFLATRPL